MATEYTSIIVEKERGRARITLNRPEKLNALSRGSSRSCGRRSGTPMRTPASTPSSSEAPGARSAPATT